MTQPSLSDNSSITPNPAIHSFPTSTQQGVPTQQDWGTQFIESIVRDVVNLLTGGLFGDAAANAVGAFINLFHNLFGIFQDLNPITLIQKFITSVENFNLGDIISSIEQVPLFQPIIALVQGVLNFFQN